MREDIKERIELIRKGKVPRKYVRTSIGVIPNSWKELCMNQCVTIVSGLVDPREKPYTSMKHIGSENIEKDTGEIIDIHTASEQGLISGKYVFDNNSIIYSKVRPRLNKVCIPDFSGICSADCYVLHTKDNIKKRYLYYYMLSECFLKQVISCSMRTKMPKINQAELNAIKIFVPGLEEQCKIMHLLDEYSKYINLLGQQINEKKKQKMWLMQMLLTGRKRLPKFKDKWKIQQMEKVFDERIEINMEEKELLSITSKGILPRSELQSKDNSSDNKSKYKRICVGDIGYNTMRMWQGVSALSEYDGIVSPAYTILIPHDDVDAKFFSYLFKLPSSIFKFYRYSQGLVDDTRNLKYDYFKKISFTYPSDVKEQRLIAEILSKADKEIELLEKKLELIKQEKKAMMQLLLTGIVRVSGEKMEVD